MTPVYSIRRTSRTVKSACGTSTERRDYDAHGRLVEIASFGTSVKYRYDAKDRIARQTIDGSPIDFTYTKYGRLAGKYLGGREKPDASVEYEYSKSGQIVARTANGVRQTYEYDGRGQLLAVKENGTDVERYVYDKAGNMLKKTIRGTTTTFTFDGANQLVNSTTDGVTTKYAYDAAGRLVREGDKTYRYGYLDKVLSVTEGEQTYTYDYHVDGQLARANYGNGGRAGRPLSAVTEDFLWDGLALIKRGDERFVNEPHIGGGNPVASLKGTTYFNDILGTTVGAKSGKYGKYTPAALTAFGEDISAPGTKHQAPSTFYTGKPQVDGLGHAFLFRNYRASLAKWQTADPLGYPDGWNQLAYCGNGVLGAVDVCGCECVGISDETIWHEYKDPVYSYYTDGIYPLVHPSIPKSTSGDEVKDVLKRLMDLTVTLKAETSIWSSTWEFYKSSGERRSGNYVFEEYYSLGFDVLRVDHYAYYSKSNLLSVINGMCTTAGAAAAIVAVFFPQVSIPAGYIGSGASVGGFMAWISDEIADDDCRTLIFSEYKGVWSGKMKTEFLHRRIE